MKPVEKLQIEKLTEQDFPLHLQLVSNTKVMKMISGKPLNNKEARKKFRSILQSNDLHADFGYFKITDSQTGNFIGVAKLEIKAKDSNTAELGYLILPEFWGKGIVSIVAKRIMEKAKSQTQLHKVYAIIDPENIPSRRILEKNGFQSKESKYIDGLPGEILELILRPQKDFQ